MDQYTETPKPQQSSQQIMYNSPPSKLLVLKLQDFEKYLSGRSALCFEPLQSCFSAFISQQTSRLKTHFLLTIFVPSHDSGR